MSGREFKIVGGKWDGEHGNSLDLCYWRDEEFVDEFALKTAGHVRTDLGSTATYVPRSIWRRMDDRS